MHSHAPAPTDTTSTTTVRTLIDEFLADQAATAVQRFSRTHETMEAPDAGRPRHYRDLMPAAPPGPGQQYAFEVDLDACSGCKACVVACERLNGLPSGSSFRSVGTLVGGGTHQLPVLRNVTTACHHCLEPGCLSGCPVDAYEKDPITGIVRHLDDQCIGCQYCTLTCPYEVPNYDQDRGIVRKCDLCSDRLSVGEAPACAQACPTQAIRIRVVDVDEAVREAADGWPFAAPDAATTLPTTHYRSTENLRDEVHAVDRGTVAPAHAHPPLTVMLVLTQVAVGTMVGLVALDWLPGTSTAEVASLPLAVIALATGVLAMGASVLHLGRPQYAWRAVIGLRHSWLSREIVAFGVFAPLTAVYAASVAGWAPLVPIAGWIGPVAAGAGVVGVATSVMVYAVTRRRWWSIPRVAGRFALTTGLGGTAVLLAFTSVLAATGHPDMQASMTQLARAASVFGILGLTAEAALRRHRHRPLDDELARTAQLLDGPLRWLVVTRSVLLVLGTVVGPWMAVGNARASTPSLTAGAVAGVVALLAVLGSELLERWRFFTASSPTRMPGRLP